MKKKISVLLVVFMLGGGALYAMESWPFWVGAGIASGIAGCTIIEAQRIQEEGNYSGDGLGIIGISMAGLAGVCVVVALLNSAGVFAEADAPDDGMYLTSYGITAKRKIQSNTSLETAINVLNHVDIGVTPSNKLYAGVRFRF